ncbi:LysM peptidoglycan-binding domain-containing protein [Glaciihabitans sp. UYNi722]|uniref:LysM peptidoglycan-binding domain-containing protein n=1 Tax=Glaciihabitans sp. UYNi722 TaxID=3156344 RepID=UPI00339085C5
MSTAIINTAGINTAGINTAGINTVSASPRLHLTKRGRVVLTGLAALPLVIGAFFVATNGGGATATDEPTSVSFEHVTVQSGQTLWQIAGELAPSADPRDVVADIVHLNQLSGADLQAGQQLAIPTQYSH